MACAGIKFRVLDIVAAMDRIDHHVRDQTLDAFRDDVDKQWLVERGLLIISEAARHLPDTLTSRHPHSRWPAIRQIGNRIRHECGRLDSTIIWSIATLHLTELRVAVTDMITDIDEAP